MNMVRKVRSALPTIRRKNKSSSTSGRMKGYIDNWHSLSIRGWIAPEEAYTQGDKSYQDCEAWLNNQWVQTFNATEMRGDLLALPDISHGLGFEFQLPLQKIALIVNESDIINIKIKYQDQTLKHELNIPTDEYIRSAISELKDDINRYVAYLPLFTSKSIKLLSDYQKLKLIDVLLTTGLYKKKQSLFDELLISTQYFVDISSSEIVNIIESLRYQNEFIAGLIKSAGTKLTTHPLYSVICRTLKGMMYLEAKDIIEQSISDQILKNQLIKTCVVQDEEKFTFIEHFPQDINDGIKIWNELTNDQQHDYWPLLAGTLQFQGRYQDLRFIAIDPLLYMDADTTQFDSKENILKAALNKKENDWFSLSFVVQALVTGRPHNEVATLLQEYSRKSWHLNYFNSDVFSYIINEIIDKNPETNTYQLLVSALQEVLNFKSYKDINSLYRKCFLKSIAQAINYGIVHQMMDFTKLAETARKNYCLNNDYMSLIDFEPLKLYAREHHQYLADFYGKVRLVNQFFSDFDANNSYSEMQLRDIFDLLLLLKNTHGILRIDKRLLALSRYCQLNEITALYPYLQNLHEQIGDTYGALTLAKNDNEKVRLEQRITESGDFVRRADSEWFIAALKARATLGSQNTAQFVVQLHAHLSVTDNAAMSPNNDLVNLLLSEILWLALGDSAATAKSEELLAICASLCEKYAVTMLAEVRMIVYLQNQQRLKSSEQLDSLAEVLGSFEKLIQITVKYDVNLNSLQEKQNCKQLIRSIREQNIYPYTRVMVYSCNKYISCRHQIIRDSWLPKLKSYGIDYNFVVGDAEQSHIDGDLMRLNVSDTYEELPHKSLTMFEFAAQTSYHRHYYKLDDDCILNIDAMFGDPAFLGHAYYGRIVSRPLGGVDRSWHHEKSATQEAKAALDLSPELSTYCDGSTGYILDRKTVQILTEQAHSLANVQLIASSYFEDKLVGDLLSIANVSGVFTGYNTVVRRGITKAQDCQIWEYGLLSTSVNNVKVLHTEDNKFRLNFGKSISENFDGASRLIFRDITKNLKPNMITDQETEPVLEQIKVDRKKISNADVIAILVSKNEHEFMPNLLAHHRAIGIEHFLYIDNASSDISVEYMLAQEDVSVFMATQDYKFSRFGVNWQETLCSHYGLGKWVLIIDSDELFVYDGFEQRTIQELTTLADEEGATAILSPMIDFYPKGSLAEADITMQRPFYETCTYFDSLESMTLHKPDSYGPFSNSKIYSGGLRERIFGRYNLYPAPNYLNQKYNLFKYQPGMRLIEGLHFMQGHQTFSKQCGIMHFKYNAGFHQKVIREIKSGQHWNGAKEYKRYIELFHSNKEVKLLSKDFSIEYTDISSLIDAGYVSEIKW